MLTLGWKRCLQRLSSNCVTRVRGDKDEGPKQDDVRRSDARRGVRTSIAATAKKAKAAFYSRTRVVLTLSLLTVLCQSTCLEFLFIILYSLGIGRTWDYLSIGNSLILLDLGVLYIYVKAWNDFCSVHSSHHACIFGAFWKLKGEICEWHDRQGDDYTFTEFWCHFWSRVFNLTRKCQGIIGLREGFLRNCCRSQKLAQFFPFCFLTYVKY